MVKHHQLTALDLRFPLVNIVQTEICLKLENFNDLNAYDNADLWQ